MLLLTHIFHFMLPFSNFVMSSYDCISFDYFKCTALWWTGVNFKCAIINIFTFDFKKRTGGRRGRRNTQCIITQCPRPVSWHRNWWWLDVSCPDPRNWHGYRGVLSTLISTRMREMIGFERLNVLGESLRGQNSLYGCRLVINIYRIVGYNGYNKSLVLVGGEQWSLKLLKGE